MIDSLCKKLVCLALCLELLMHGINLGTEELMPCLDVLVMYHVVVVMHEALHRVVVVMHEVMYHMVVVLDEVPKALHDW